ncbi:MAG: sensor histidine kinase [Bacteroidia bacterium]|nr:sensor histidine kinase [Bacteroidia bacterium]
MLISFYTLNFYKDEIHFGDFLWISLIIVLAFWGLGKKMGWLFYTLGILNISVYFLFFAKSNISSIKEINNNTIYSLFFEVFFAYTAISIVLVRFVRNYELSLNKLKTINHELEEKTTILIKKNNENQALLKEVHHRVKNNLQIIISLLRLQKNNLQKNAENNYIDIAINRIMAMSLIHKKLYQSEDLSEVDLESYIRELIVEIQKSFNYDIEVKLNLNIDYCSMKLKTLVPLGLIINELVTNSYKHAFNNLDKGQINIQLKIINKIDFEMIYSDNGTWKEIPNNGFGINLIDTLCHQLDGNFIRKGSEYKFRLKNLDND